CDTAAVLNLTIAAPVSVIATTTDAICTIPGTITVTTPLPGTGISYSIDGINFQPNNIFTSVAAGPYTVIVNDAGGCSATKSVTVNQVSNTLTINQTVTDAICTTNNGSIK